jgi:hypothetical protein
MLTMTKQTKQTKQTTMARARLAAPLAALVFGGCATEGSLFEESRVAKDLALASAAILSSDTELVGPIVNLGDIDGDGREDLAEVRASDVRIRYGRALARGTTAYVPDVELQTTDARFFLSTYVVAAGDLDGDGLADFVIGSQQGGAPAYVIYGRRAHLVSGTFAATADAALDPEIARVGATAPQFLGADPITAVGDLDHDGHADLMLTRWISNGNRASDQQYVSQILYGKRWSGPVAAADATRRAPGRFATMPLALGDFDGDGYADVAFDLQISAPLTTENSYAIWGSATRVSGDRAWTSEAPLFTGFFGAVTPLGDLDGDGAHDLAVNEVTGLRIVYGGGRPSGVTAASRPGALLTSPNSLSAPVAGRVPAVNAPTTIAVSNFNDPGSVFVVPAGPHRLTGEIALPGGLSYVGHPREFCMRAPCSQPDVTARVGRPILSDQDGDGKPELLVVGPGVAGQLPNLLYIVSASTPQ